MLVRRTGCTGQRRILQAPSLRRPSSLFRKHLTEVHAAVPREAPLVDELLATDVALEALHSRVYGLMHCELALLRKGLPTALAAERPLSRVRTFVEDNSNPAIARVRAVAALVFVHQPPVVLQQAPGAEEGCTRHAADDAICRRAEHCPKLRWARNTSVITRNVKRTIRACTSIHTYLSSNIDKMTGLLTIVG